jgi:hypothetical protein
MKSRFRLYRRKKGGMFYAHDSETGKQESLGIKDRAEASTLLNARNESFLQPQLNLHIAKAYLAGADSGVSTRTLQDALNASIPKRLWPEVRFQPKRAIMLEEHQRIIVRMKQWWQRRPLKLRLAVWFTAVASGILLGLTPAVYWLIERRLHLEFDRQLQIDWNLIKAHLESDAAGRVRWRPESPAFPDSAGYAASWFDVWSSHEPLLRHWPEGSVQTEQPPLSLQDQMRPFYTLTLDNGLPARTLEQPARRERPTGSRAQPLANSPEHAFHQTAARCLSTFTRPG